MLCRAGTHVFNFYKNFKEFQGVCEYFNLDFCHPMKCKIAVIHTLTKRARELPSTVEEKIREVGHIHSVLRANATQTACF